MTVTSFLIPTDFLDGRNIVASFGTLLLDASGDKIGGLFQANKAGTIDRIIAFCTATTGTVPTYNAELQTIGSNEPSGTILAAGASGTFTPSAGAWSEITLTTPVVVTLNQYFAAIVEHDSGTIDGSNNATFRFRQTLPELTLLSAAMSNPSTSWSDNSAAPVIGVRYDDGTYVFGSQLAEVNANVDMQFSDTINERGNTFTPLKPFELGAIRFQARHFADATNREFDVILRDSSDGTILYQETIDPGQNADVNQEVPTTHIMTSKVILSTSVTYEINISKNAAGFSADTRFDKITYRDSDAKNALTGFSGSVTRESGVNQALDTSVLYTIWPLATGEEDVVAGTGGGIAQLIYPAGDI